MKTFYGIGLGLLIFTIGFGCGQQRAVREICDAVNNVATKGSYVRCIVPTENNSFTMITSKK